MESKTANKLIKAYDQVALVFREAANEEMSRGHMGSPHNVYFHMRDSMAAERKARMVRQRYGVTSCECDTIYA